MDQPVGDVAEFEVAALAGPDQHGERLVTGDLVALHEDARGPADQLQWVNAGHPRPLLLRNGKVIQTLLSPTTLPVGIGVATPHVSEETLQPGGRVLFFTDGIIEEHLTGGEPFGTPRLIEQLERAQAEGGPPQGTVTRLSGA